MKRNQFLIRGVLLAGLLLAVLAGGGLRQARAVTPDEPTGQLVVRLADGVAIDVVASAYDASVLATMAGPLNIHLLEVSAKSAYAVADKLEDDRRVVYAEINYAGVSPEANGVDIYGWPEDDATTTKGANPKEEYDFAVGVNDVARYYKQPALSDINLGGSLGVTTGAGVTVAILDTGMDLDNFILADNLGSVMYDFVDDDLIPEEEFEGVDDDGDGYIDEVAGHGTHIAGIIVLVAPDVTLMPLRVLDSDGQGDSFVIAQAVMFAVQNGADVINLSLGSIELPTVLMDVLGYAVSQNIVVVGAAGNLNMDVAQYPASDPCVVGVSSLGNGNKKSDFASFGDWVDIAVTGEKIYSTYPDDRFAQWSGTSMAAPFVSAQAALLLGVNPDFTPAEIGALIGGTADQVNRQDQDRLGDGKINIEASVAFAYYQLWPSQVTDMLAGCGG